MYDPDMSRGDSCDGRDLEDLKLSLEDKLKEVETCLDLSRNTFTSAYCDFITASVHEDSSSRISAVKTEMMEAQAMLKKIKELQKLFPRSFDNNRETKQQEVAVDRQEKFLQRPSILRENHCKNMRQ